jgi:hypothetical protein
MLYTAKTLKGYKLDSLDGEIGKVKEFYFDDRHWTIRYLVAETGTWLTGRQVLISPYALQNVIKEEKDLSVSLTKKQIENSPSLDTHKPVSRQFEDEYYGYYGWPMYWSGSSVWGIIPTLSATATNGDNSPRRRKPGITICAALRPSLDTASKPWTARSATLRISSSMTRRGRFVILSLEQRTGGLGKRSWFHRNGSSA